MSQGVEEKDEVLAELLKKWEREEYQLDPVYWYEKRFRGDPRDIDWTLHENYKDHQWDGTPNPFKVMFDSLAEWRSVAIESATSTGKTYMLPRVIYWFLDCFEDSLVVTTAPKQSQLKNVLWSEMSAAFKRFKRIRPKSEMFSMRVLPDGQAQRFGSKFEKSWDLEDLDEDDITDRWQAIGVVSGVRADEESATKMQGFHRKYMLFIVEECAGVPQPVMTAIKNTCTGDYNIILTVGNPDSQLDALHQFAMLPHVEHIRISAYDHPNIVNGKTLIHGAVTQKSIDIRKDEYGEASNMFRSRVRGIAPKQSVDSLINYDWIQECNVNGPEFVDIELDTLSMNGLGMDVANSETGDMACLCWGKMNEVWWLHEFQCPNANHLAHNVVKTAEELSDAGMRDYTTGKVQDFGIHPGNIGVDAVGVGAGTVNEFKETLHWDIQALQGGCDLTRIPEDEEGKPLYKFRSLRAQMYFQARLDLQNHLLRINIQDKRVFDQLVKELTLVKYKVTDGYMVIESKEDIKSKLGGKSPNLADAFVYWNWVRQTQTTLTGGLAPVI